MGVKRNVDWLFLKSNISLLKFHKLSSTSGNERKYTHLHFGAVGLVLTFHGRKELSVTAKVTLYNVPLSDSTLSTRIKAQESSPNH
ncbi:hypothetical protein L6164_016946 [Bauhinia variegata]|uniref:Uncharacterized protein n=1 Tax=Bauhinia variegata TaxID=167791 RepID=A0ACB9N883_BAUVA|nr:hypothetical protein L6164_016946 [Bauhinia variegata]